MPGGLQGFPGDVNIGGNLFVQGAVTVGAGGSLAPTFPLLAPDGNAAAPSFAFSGEPNTGFYRPAAGFVGIAQLGAAKLILGGGSFSVRLGANVGLGWSTTPDASLAVADTSIFRNAAGVLEINNGTTGVFRDLIARNINAQGAGVAPGVAASCAQIWNNGAGALTFVDSTRTANNRIADFIWTGGSVNFRFINDAYGASSSWLVVTGGQAAGISNITFGGSSATVFAFAGVAGQAQKTGFGTPTGTGVITNFPGATATLAQTSQAVAQIIADLKALGFYGA